MRWLLYTPFADVFMALVVVLFTKWVHSQGTDLTTELRSTGKAVVEATVSRINLLTERSRDLLTDFRFIRRIAWVETRDGTDQSTYSDPNYHGGIWRVDRSVYDTTMRMFSNARYAFIFDDIETLLGINWSQTTWEDCRRPLYSALAARLYFHDLQPVIPQVSWC